MSHATLLSNAVVLALALAAPSFASAQDAGNVIVSRIPAGPHVAVASPRVFPRPTVGSGVAVWRPTHAPAVVIPSPRVDLGPRDLGTDPVAVRAELEARRALNVARFRAYAAAGEFPDNHVQPGMLNVFIDDEGKICAAANLVAQDGMLAAVQRAARRNNFLRLGTVRAGALYEWILTSGFTQEEVATIQEPYAYIEPDLEPPDLMLAENQERDRLQRRFREIDAQLVAAREASLELAVQRLVAHRLAERATAG